MGNTNSGSNKSAKRIRVGHHPHGNLRSNIVPEINTIIWHDYRRLAEIGGGKMGSICTAIKLERDQSSESSSETKKQYAIKEAIVAAKSKHFVECLRIEIDALKALDHPNIIKPHAVYFTRKSLYLVIQNCTGGNLYSGFKADPSTGQKVPLSEKKTAEIVHQLLSAVAHMHSHGVCHRDIKFENVLFETEHPDSKIKVIDFGIAQNVKVMYECCGTTYTMAREVLTLKGYTNKVDIWSVGVIVYMMLSLTKPFYGKNKLIITNKIMKGDFRYYSPRWETQAVSSDAKSFIEALLKKDPDKRLSAVQAMKHKWLKRELSESVTVPTEETMTKIYKSIKRYVDVSLLKKIALIIIAHHLTAEETTQIRMGFDLFDRRRNGEIDYADFAIVMKQADTHCTDDEITKWFKCMNIHDDGDINYTEFVAACLESQGCLTDDSIELAFQRLDSDHTGGISRSNLKEILGSDYSHWNIEKVWWKNSYDDDIPFDFFQILCKNVQDECE